MNPAELIQKLQSLGIVLWVDGDSIKFRAPAESLTVDLREAVTTHRREIIKLLSESPLDPHLETCSQCGGLLSISMFASRWEFHCIANPSHYEGHRRRPGAPFLWIDIPILAVAHEPETLFPKEGAR